MRRFARGVHGQQTLCRLDRAVHRAGAHARFGQPLEHRDRVRAQPLALGCRPLFEPGLSEPQSVDELAAIERRRARQCLGCRRCGQALELGDVDDHRLGIERDSLGRGLQDVVAEQTPEREQRLPQAMAGLLQIDVAPQQRRQSVARFDLPRADAEYRKQTLDLLARREGSGP